MQTAQRIMHVHFKINDSLVKDKTLWQLVAWWLQVSKLRNQHCRQPGVFLKQPVLVKFIRYFTMMLFNNTYISVYFWVRYSAKYLQYGPLWPLGSPSSRNHASKTVEAFDYMYMVVYFQPWSWWSDNTLPPAEKCDVVVREVLLLRLIKIGGTKPCR